MVNEDKSPFKECWENVEKTPFMRLLYCIEDALKSQDPDATETEALKAAVEEIRTKYRDLEKILDDYKKQLEDFESKHSAAERQYEQIGKSGQGLEDGDKKAIDLLWETHYAEKLKDLEKEATKTADAVEPLQISLQEAEALAAAKKEALDTLGQPQVDGPLKKLGALWAQAKTFSGEEDEKSAYAVRHLAEDLWATIDKEYQTKKAVDKQAWIAAMRDLVAAQCAVFEKAKAHAHAAAEAKLAEQSLNEFQKSLEVNYLFEAAQIEAGGASPEEAAESQTQREQAPQEGVSAHPIS